MLDAVTNFLPNPIERPVLKAELIQKPNHFIERKVSKTEKLLAFPFKIIQLVNTDEQRVCRMCLNEKSGHEQI